MKLALILTVVDPKVGGVLLMGHRGTAKSTAVRGLADLLPRIARIKGCIFGCDPSRRAEWCADCLKRHRDGSRPPFERVQMPVVELPLAATEDRVCGTLDIERALTRGVKTFEAGLLARAHRGFLYIDEVNLLEDHLIDLLLDVAASGRNVVEREGISMVHPARFVLVGSGNPGEGELRPQLLDRFGLYVTVATSTDIAARIEIIRRRERFDRDPAAFRLAVEAGQADVRRRITRGRKLVSQVRMPDDVLGCIGELCVRLRVETHRGELTLMRAAQAYAAYDGRTLATVEDVRRVAVMSLRHRLRSAAEGVDPGVRIERAVGEILGPVKLRTIAAGHA